LARPARRAALDLLLFAAAAVGLAWAFVSPRVYALAPEARDLAAAVRGAFVESGHQEQLLGGGVDLPGTVWTFAQVHRWLLGEVGTVDPDMYSPLGFDWGVAQGFAWTDAVLAAPLLSWLGVPGFYNLHVLLTLAGTALGAMLAFRAAGAPRLLCAGLAVPVLANPFVIGEVAQGRPTQAHLLLHGLFLSAVVGVGRAPGLGRAAARGALAGALLAAACLVYWFSGVAVGALGGIGLLGLIVTGGARRAEGLVGGLCTAAVALGLGAALTWRMASGLGDGGALAGILPAPWGWWAWGPVQLPLQRAPLPVDGWAELAQILDARGLGALPLLLLAPLLALPALPRGDARGALLRRAPPWALAAALTSTLCLGAGLVHGRSWTPTLFPFLQLAFPPLARCYQVDRLAVAGLLGLPLVAAVAAGGLRGRARGAAALAGALIGGLAWGGLPAAGDLKVQQMGPEGVYAEAARVAPGGIIDVPLIGANDWFGDQVFHRQPLLGGMGVKDRGRPAGHAAWCDQNPTLASMEALAFTGAGAVDPAGLAELRAAGFTVVVVHFEHSQADPAAWSRALGAPPISGSRSRKAWRLPAPP
jgi:hypothetical protein